MSTKGIVIAGLSGGSGKSVVAVGIVAALAATGRVVVPFKKGPDYIDAGWLQLASGRKCYNLDPYLMKKEVILTSFYRRAEGADWVVVEGNRGLYDGVNAEGGYSTAELAVILGLPIVLVVNCTKTTRTIAALVMGCQHFDPRVKIAGVILNQIATKRQKKLITEAVERYTGLPVLGAVPRLQDDIFPMRHLGMIPHQEYGDSRGALATLVELARENIDLQRLQEVMGEVIPPAGALVRPTAVVPEGAVRIGVLQDAAFQFYYSENLEALETAGAELVYINALTAKTLPPIDGLYIGGGFPETSAGALSANVGFCQEIRAAAEAGLPIYAECGGLIYLGTAIELEGQTYPLVGLFPASFAMAKKPQAHGYTILQADRENAYYPVSTEIRGHEFRYSVVTEWRGGEEMLAFAVKRGKGFWQGRDGLIYRNVLALYTHTHAEGTPQWAGAFAARCRAVKRENGEVV